MCAAFCWKFYKFAANINNLLPMAKDINRIKVVLVVNVDIKELLNSTKS